MLYETISSFMDEGGTEAERMAHMSSLTVRVCVRVGPWWRGGWERADASSCAKEQPEAVEAAEEPEAWEESQPQVPRAEEESLICTPHGRAKPASPLLARGIAQGAVPLGGEARTRPGVAREGGRVW